MSRPFPPCAVLRDLHGPNPSRIFYQLGRLKTTPAKVYKKSVPLSHFFCAKQGAMFLKTVRSCFFCFFSTYLFFVFCFLFLLLKSMKVGRIGNKEKQNKYLQRPAFLKKRDKAGRNFIYLI